MSEAIVAKIGAVVLIRKFVRRLILTDVDPALRRACKVLLIERDDFEVRIKDLHVALIEAVGYLKVGKVKFAPNTTNSHVDYFIEKWAQDDKAKGDES